MTTVAEALAAARASLPPNEARLLLGHLLRRATGWLLAHDEEILDGTTLQAFAALTARRAGGEPVAYLVGKREFFGREFAVAPAVLIPRAETELLVEIVLAKVSRAVAEERSLAILDLGTGSGCIAVTLALEIPRARLCAVDLDAAALALARDNAERHGATLRLAQCDWFAGLTGERFDFIVANPPYVAAADPRLAASDLRHEPRSALASGADGLDALRRIVAAAPAHLAPGGQLWVEHGYDQAEAVRELLAATGFVGIEQHRDLAGILRVSGGRAA
jgi:release factor glutamine methyltransferase